MNSEHKNKNSLALFLDLQVNVIYTKMLCPRCGKETKLGLCEKCFFELKPIKLEKIELLMCSCGNYKTRVEWKNNVDVFLNKTVRKNLMVPDGVSIENIDVVSKLEGKKMMLDVKIDMLFAGRKISQTLKDEIRIKNGTCETCGSLRGFTAILQFRDFEPEISIRPEVLTKAERTKNGLDFYITKKEYAREIAKKFKKMGFEVKESHTLFGIDDSGKRRSRLTISVRKQK